MSNFSSALLPPESQVLLQTLEDRLNQYIEKMSPGVRITNEEGGFQQQQLWRGVIKFLLDQPPQIFIAGWTLFLSKILENRQGCFSPMYMNRFRELLKLPLDERRNFERLVHLAYVSCDPKARALAMKQIEMHHILSMLPNEAQRQKIIAFYQL